jgi:hypothetical protein
MYDTSKIRREEDNDCILKRIFKIILFIFILAYGTKLYIIARFMKLGKDYFFFY